MELTTKWIKTAVLTCAGLALVSLNSLAQPPDWLQISQAARGQHVYLHAWGGSQEVNRYLVWAAAELHQQTSVHLHHVKVTNVAEVMTRLLAEKMAGKHSEGSVDIIWLNGENFSTLKHNAMLYGPFVEGLPNWHLVDKSLPVLQDFSEPTQGLEAPWGLAQLHFIYDKARLSAPPQTFAELLAYAKRHPYRLTYPKPPEFHGVSFLKALLLELSDNDPRLQQAVDDTSYASITAPLWRYLDEFHRYAWRKGQLFPAGSAQTLQLLDDNQIDLAISFNPNAVAAAKAAGVLAATAEAYALQQGALSNVHFLAIPWNASAKQGAMVAINFLLSRQAQSHKSNLAVWGDPSVLASQHLSESAQNNFQFAVIAEPHASWQTRLEQDWLARYGS